MSRFFEIIFFKFIINASYPSSSLFTNHSNKKDSKFCNISRADSIMRVACIHVYVTHTRTGRSSFFRGECTMLVSIVEIPLRWNISQRIVKLDLLDSVLSPAPRYCFRFREIWVVHIMYKLAVYRVHFLSRSNFFYLAW